MKNVLDYLEKSAKDYKNKVAIIEDQSSITYNELLNMSQGMGTVVAEKNIEVNNPIPIIVFMDKGIKALVSFLGIVYSGNFYAMANVDLPDDRLKSQQLVLEAGYIVTDSGYIDRAKQIYDAADIINIDDYIFNKPMSVNEKLLSDIRSRHLDVNPLYANFTSGSTGIPKAVLVNHRSVIDFIDCFTDIFGINQEDVLANQAPFDFDVSVKDIYSTLKKGATLVIIPKEYFSQPVKLLDMLCEKNITTMIWAVSALCLITTFHGLDYKVPKKVNKVLFSGEVMPMKHLAAWMTHLPEAVFVNLYGPTEITCNCTYHVVERDRDYSNVLPIGKPFPNEEIILLDVNDTPVNETGKTGEICVRGTALALGYYNSVEQTSKVFCQNPLNKFYPDIIYRTGDLGYYNELGELCFNGRKDFQIKHMGHRIELEEIELAINNIDGIERSSVIFYEEKSKLYGFYIGDVDKRELHRILSERLPVFMVPGILERVEEFPLTKNGKTDKRKLLQDKLDKRGMRAK